MPDLPQAPDATSREDTDDAIESAACAMVDQIAMTLSIGDLDDEERVALMRLVHRPLRDLDHARAKQYVAEANAAACSALNGRLHAQLIACDEQVYDCEEHNAELRERVTLMPLGSLAQFERYRRVIADQRRRIEEHHEQLCKRDETIIELSEIAARLARAQETP